MKKQILFLALVSLLAILGCETSVDLMDEDKALYTVYASNNMDDPIHFIRVKDMSKPLIHEEDGVLNAKVILNNLTDGTFEVLRDSIIKFNGVKTHNFYTANTEHGKKYELKIEGSDGRLLTATATTPDIVIAEVITESGFCDTPLVFRFYPIHDVRQVVVRFTFPKAPGIVYPEEVWLGENDTLFMKSNLLEAIRTGFLSGKMTCSDLESPEVILSWGIVGPGFYDYTFSDTLGIPGGYGYFRFFSPGSTDRFALDLH